MIDTIHWLNVNQGFTISLLTTVYVVATIFMASKMVKANSLTAEMIKTSKELEQNRTRPYLIFDLITDEKQIVYAELRNEGLTSARNVKLSVEPEIVSGDRNGHQCAFTANTLSFLASGRHLKDFIGTGWRFFEENKDSKFKYVITYEDFAGNTYSEEAIIDTAYLCTLQKINPPVIGKELERVHKEVHDLNRTLVKLWRQPLQVNIYNEKTD